MASRSKSFYHSVLSAGQNVAARSHGPTDENRLTSQLIIYWNQWMVRRKCSSGTLKKKIIIITNIPRFALNIYF